MYLHPKFFALALITWACVAGEFNGLPAKNSERIDKMEARIKKLEAQADLTARRAYHQKTLQELVWERDAVSMDGDGYLHRAGDPEYKKPERSDQTIRVGAGDCSEACYRFDNFATPNPKNDTHLKAPPLSDKGEFRYYLDDVTRHIRISRDGQPYEDTDIACPEVPQGTIAIGGPSETGISSPKGNLLLFNGVKLGTSRATGTIPQDSSHLPIFQGGTPLTDSPLSK